MSQKDGTEGGFPDADPSAPTESVSVDQREGLIAPGQVLGNRYHIHSPLGRGGMGEVWRAFDLKLRVEVALKALRKDRFRDERRLELLRREVRAAREVVSPNVCRIFDLIEADGTELVSMEYVDGGTLLEVLQERGPLDLKEAQDIASQFLAGLEAIHAVGLVHRDVKPENIMITRAGRVVLMDFGLARQEDSGSGTVAGTPAYMAPEQASGQKVDARADVYAAGVVLAEMVSPEGIKSLDSRKSLWKGVRSDPAQLPATPWAPVLTKAVAKEPDQRYNSAHTLTRALEDVTLRVEGAEDLNPYPGLASFTEADAEYFFGREAEVERMWRTIEGPARLLGLVGPSGAGKTSFVRAGLIPGAGASWSIVRFTPGNAPFISLGQALAPGTTGDPDAMRLLPKIQEIEAAVELVSRWCGRGMNSLLVVDQFEELFTQNLPEAQSLFTALLARLPLEAEAHVLLSMRDDFLMECNRFEVMRPIVAGLTLLDPPTGANLRRALVQPAMKCGYRFEDDELVGEMLAEVEGERGALPLLAFAMSRLWEKRDRENGLLTRQAYHDIGGVAGALARHAEATMDRIGRQRHLIVRELFRNLVTAEGIRAVRTFDDLLSVFEESDQAASADTLNELIDARLLTSYEVHDEDEQPNRTVEIIHESLLAAWPRLVRWQTQDADAAQLRDQLRQAARTWDEHGRSDDLLWTGSAYREYASWRERYPGGLSDTEEAFGSAMTALAGRRRRRRRFVAAATFVVLLAVLAVVGSFWRQSVRETRRAEAQKLIALGQLELDSYPTAAVAYATASLELADGPAARLLALEALWKGPTAFTVSDDVCLRARFSPDGSRLATTLEHNLRVFGEDGSGMLLERVHGARDPFFQFSPGGEIICSYDKGGPGVASRVVLWSATDGRRFAERRYDDPAWPELVSCGDQRAVVLVVEEGVGNVDAVYPDGSSGRLGSLGVDLLEAAGRLRPTSIDDRTGRWLGVAVDDEVLVVEIDEHGIQKPRSLGRHQDTVIRVAVHPTGRLLASIDRQGLINLWDPTGRFPPTPIQGPAGVRQMIGFSPDGSLLDAKSVDSDEREKWWVWSLTGERPEMVRRFDLGPRGGTGGRALEPHGMNFAKAGPDLKTRLWTTGAPADADPVEMLRGRSGILWSPSFHPQGGWLLTTSNAGAAVWPLARSYPSVIRHHTRVVYGLVFGPRGDWLASASVDRTVRLWPLGGDLRSEGRILVGPPLRDRMLDLAVSPDGSRILVGTGSSGPRLVPLDGGPSRVLSGFEQQTSGVAISPGGRFAAAVGGEWEPRERLIRVWDVETGQETAVLGPDDDLKSFDLVFTDGNHILSGGNSRLLRWDLESGRSEVLYGGIPLRFAAPSDAAWVLVQEAEVASGNSPGQAIVVDLENGNATSLDTHGDRVLTVAVDPRGTIAVTGGVDGVIRVGPITGEEPHLLLGHQQSVDALAVDPLGRWIASAGEDTTVRLWPMPDLSKPPLHTLPREQLIAKLKTLTNLRVIRDEESATGWTLTHDPFPGWETVPTW